MQMSRWLEDVVESSQNLGSSHALIWSCWKGILSPKQLVQRSTNSCFGRLDISVALSCLQQEESMSTVWLLNGCYCIVCYVIIYGLVEGIGSYYISILRILINWFDLMHQSLLCRWGLNSSRSVGIVVGVLREVNLLSLTLLVTAARRSTSTI